MDVWVGVMFGIGLVYVMVVAAQWAFRRDAEARKAPRPEATPRRVHLKHPDLKDLDALVKRAFDAFDRRPPE